MYTYIYIHTCIYIYVYTYCMCVYIYIYVVYLLMSILFIRDARKQKCTTKLPMSTIIPATWDKGRYESSRSWIPRGSDLLQKRRALIIRTGCWRILTV